MMFRMKKLIEQVADEDYGLPLTWVNGECDLDGITILITADDEGKAFVFYGTKGGLVYSLYFLKKFSDTVIKYRLKHELKKFRDEALENK